MRDAIATAGIALVTFMLCVLAPLRPLSGDTVPGRIGGAVVRCAGDFDLEHVDWVRTETAHDRLFYWLQRDEAGEHTSVFGPAPAAVMAVALLAFGDGDRIDDDTLRRRERGVAAVLLAIATVLLVLAARARVTLPRALLAGAVCTLSFAGAGTLGQGLWQATTALPALTGALATLAWRDRRPRLALATPALLLLAVMLRPTMAPLVLGIGITWARGTPDRRSWLIATVAALVLVAPLIVYNAIHLWSPLPLGQWNANARATQHVFSLADATTGVAGLLVSPARGLLWFAPIVIVGTVLGMRNASYRWIAGGIVLQILAMGMFYLWHGGQAFGPRFLTEATWVGTWLALGTELTARRWLLGVAITVTILVGSLALWRYRPEQWEFPRRPEAHPSLFWNVVDSPIPATFTDPPRGAVRAYDSPPVNGLACERGQLRSY
ncbi:MAG TPA: hypothetical protein VFV99_07490 [Kofleriaceae bacterium]|nr:hypothetical protein [Kofleriaceae bacterium]